jgi:hypothetical protein
VVFQIEYDPDGTGTHAVTQLYQYTGLAVARPGYQQLTEALVRPQSAFPVALPATFQNGTVTLRVWAGTGFAPLRLRTDAAGEQGRVSYLTVPLTVTNQAPQDVFAGPDQKVLEGAPAAFRGSFTDPNHGDTHAQTWTVVGSGGTVLATGTGADFSFTPGKPGTYEVTYAVTDSQGDTTTHTAIVMVRGRPERQFVRALYRDVLGREADESGFLASDEFFARATADAP